MKYLRWKPTLSFYVLATFLLFLYQIPLLLEEKYNGPRYIFISTSSTSFLFSIIQALLGAVLLSLPVFFYSNRTSLRIRKLAYVVYDWGKGKFPVTIQDDSKDDIGELTRCLNDTAQSLQKWMETQQETASVNERNQLARELHDSVKQQIFALAFQISIARKIHPSKDDQMAMHLQEAKNILGDIQEELTNLIIPMRQGALENQDLTDAMAAYLSRWSHQYGIFVKFTTEIQGQEKNYFFSSHVKGTFFRVTQEALSNVGRHSKAASVHVTITIGWQYIILKIADDGQGFDSKSKHKKGGIGLSSMKERMDAINGELSIESKPLSGTRIIAIYRPKETGPNIAAIKTIRR